MANKLAETIAKDFFSGIDFAKIESALITARELNIIQDFLPIDVQERLKDPEFKQKLMSGEIDYSGKPLETTKLVSIDDVSPEEFAYEDEALAEAVAIVKFLNMLESMADQESVAALSESIISLVEAAKIIPRNRVLDYRQQAIDAGFFQQHGKAKVTTPVNVITKKVGDEIVTAPTTSKEVQKTGKGAANQFLVDFYTTMYPRLKDMINSADSAKESIGSKLANIRKEGLTTEVTADSIAPLVSELVDIVKSANPDVSIENVKKIRQLVTEDVLRMLPTANDREKFAAATDEEKAEYVNKVSDAGSAYSAALSSILTRGAQIVPKTEVATVPYKTIDSLKSSAVELKDNFAGIKPYIDALTKISTPDSGTAEVFMQGIEQIKSSAEQLLATKLTDEEHEAATQLVGYINALLTEFEEPDGKVVWSPSIPISDIISDLRSFKSSFKKLDPRLIDNAVKPLSSLVSESTVKDAKNVMVPVSQKDLVGLDPTKAAKETGAAKSGTKSMGIDELNPVIDIKNEIVNGIKLGKSVDDIYTGIMQMDKFRDLDKTNRKIHTELSRILSKVGDNTNALYDGKQPFTKNDVDAVAKTFGKTADDAAAPLFAIIAYVNNLEKEYSKIGESSSELVEEPGRSHVNLFGASSDIADSAKAYDFYKNNFLKMKGTSGVDYSDDEKETLRKLGIDAGKESRLKEIKVALNSEKDPAKIAALREERKKILGKKGEQFIASLDMDPARYSNIGANTPRDVYEYLTDIQNGYTKKTLEKELADLQGKLSAETDPEKKASIESAIDTKTRQITQWSRELEPGEKRFLGGVNTMVANMLRELGGPNSMILNSVVKHLQLSGVKQEDIEQALFNVGTRLVNDILDGNIPADVIPDDIGKAATDPFLREKYNSASGKSKIKEGNYFLKYALGMIGRQPNVVRDMWKGVGYNKKTSMLTGKDVAATKYNPANPPTTAGTSGKRLSMGGSYYARSEFGDTLTKKIGGKPVIDHVMNDLYLPIPGQLGKEESIPVNVKNIGPDGFAYAPVYDETGDASDQFKRITSAPVQFGQIKVLEDFEPNSPEYQKTYELIRNTIAAGNKREAHARLDKAERAIDSAKLQIDESWSELATAVGADERSKAIKSLINSYGYTQEDAKAKLADRVKKVSGTITDKELKQIMSNNESKGLDKAQKVAAYMQKKIETGEPIDSSFDLSDANVKAYSAKVKNFRDSASQYIQGEIAKRKTSEKSGALAKSKAGRISGSGLSTDINPNNISSAFFIKDVLPSRGEWEKDAQFKTTTSKGEDISTDLIENADSTVAGWDGGVIDQLYDEYSDAVYEKGSEPIDSGASISEKKYKEIFDTIAAEPDVNNKFISGLRRMFDNADIGTTSKMVKDEEGNIISPERSGFDVNKLLVSFRELVHDKELMTKMDDHAKESINAYSVFRTIQEKVNELLSTLQTKIDDLDVSAEKMYGPDAVAELGVLDENLLKNSAETAQFKSDERFAEIRTLQASKEKLERKISDLAEEKDKLEKVLETIPMEEEEDRANAEQRIAENERDTEKATMELEGVDQEFSKLQDLMKEYAAKNSELTQERSDIYKTMRDIKLPNGEMPSEEFRQMVANRAFLFNDLRRLLEINNKITAEIENTADMFDETKPLNEETPEWVLRDREGNPVKIRAQLQDTILAHENTLSQMLEAPGTDFDTFAAKIGNAVRYALGKTVSEEGFDIEKLDPNAVDKTSADTKETGKAIQQMVEKGVDVSTLGPDSAIEKENMEVSILRAKLRDLSAELANVSRALEQKRKEQAAADVKYDSSALQSDLSNKKTALENLKKQPKTIANTNAIYKLEDDIETLQEKIESPDVFVGAIDSDVEALQDRLDEIKMDINVTNDDLNDKIAELASAEQTNEVPVQLADKRDVVYTGDNPELMAKAEKEKKKIAEATPKRTSAPKTPKAPTAPKKTFFKGTIPQQDVKAAQDRIVAMRERIKQEIARKKEALSSKT
jgi:hypothetical protein